MKKISALVVSALLVLFLSLSVCAAPDYYIDDSGYFFDTVNDSKGSFLTDDADLFTPEEEAKLLKKVDEIRVTYGIDFVLHTTNSIGNKSVQDYADDYFDYNDYTDDGLLFMLNMEGRDYYTSTEGIAIDVVTDASREYIESVIIDDLSVGNYYTAFDRYVTEIGNCFAADKSGEAYPPKTLTDYLMQEIVVIGAAILIAFVVGSIIKKQMNNAVQKTEANQYLVPGTLNITGGNDMFVHKTVTTVKEPKSSETHRSSGGNTHGGGGGKF